MSKNNSKGLAALRQKLKKYVRTLETEIASYREVSMTVQIDVMFFYWDYCIYILKSQSDGSMRQILLLFMFIWFCFFLLYRIDC